VSPFKPRTGTDAVPNWHCCYNSLCIGPKHNIRIQNDSKDSEVPNRAIFPTSCSPPLSQVQIFSSAPGFRTLLPHKVLSYDRGQDSCRVFASCDTMQRASIFRTILFTCRGSMSLKRWCLLTRKRFDTPQNNKRLCSSARVRKPPD
jgi:hypothetical protein